LKKKLPSGEGKEREEEWWKKQRRGNGGGVGHMSTSNHPLAIDHFALYSHTQIVVSYFFINEKMCLM